MAESDTMMTRDAIAARIPCTPKILPDIQEVTESGRLVVLCEFRLNGSE